jgi:glutathionyl-hydroquinone reductase
MTDTTATRQRFASEVDIETYGDYRIRREPGDERPLYRFAERISADGSRGLAARSGRFHVYAGWFCPWSQRVILEIALRGLQDVVSVSYVDGARDGRGWAFREPTGPDPVNGFTLLREAYDATTADFDGHISVPTLWDRQTGRVASNVYRTLGIDLATQFDAFASGAPTYAADDVAEIEALDSWIGPDVNQGVGAAGQGDPDAREALLAAFARLDAILAERRYLLGEHVTEADVRLWVTLVRYDVGANAARTINAGLHEYPHLWAYARDLHSLPAFRETTDLSSFTAAGAEVPDWSEPHDRASLGGVA